MREQVGVTQNEQQSHEETHHAKELAASKAYPDNEHKSWTSLPREILELGRGVDYLDLLDCNQLRRLPLDLFDKLPGLRRLDLDDCESLDGPFPDPRRLEALAEWGFKLEVHDSSAACKAWALGLEQSGKGMTVDWG